jgi:predicted permease
MTALLETTLREARLATRALTRQPGFAAAAVLSLTLGIAPNVVIFTFVKAVFLPHLPISDPGRVVLVYSKTTNRSGQVIEYQSTSYPNARDYQQRNDVFSALGVIVDDQATVNAGAGDAPAAVNLVGPEYAETLGVRPALGRFITVDENGRTPAPVMVISDALWRQQFAADPAVVGRSVALNRRPYTVIGVMPPEFHDIGGVPRADAWVPLAQHDDVLTGNTRAWFDLRATRVATMVGRLKAGVSVVQAQAAMTAIGKQLEDEFPQDNAGRNVILVPLEHAVVAPAERPLFQRAAAMTLIVVALVLLIACANVANLLLAKSVQRRREFAIRLAIGASSGQIVRQVLAEALVLAGCGAATGALLALWMRSAIQSRLPAGLPQNLDFSFDTRVVLFTFGAALVSTVAFGAVPAWRASSARESMVQDAGDLRGMASGVRMSDLFVIAQVGMTLAAVVTATLFLRSLLEVEKTDLGFDLRKHVLLSIDGATLGYSPERTRELLDDLVPKLRSMANVERVGVADTAPLAGTFRRTTWPAEVDGSDPAYGTVCGTEGIEPGFLSAAGIRLRRGRDFDERDDRNAPMVALVNEAAAAALWRGADPVGKRLRFLATSWEVSVVGVVNTVTSSEPGESPQPIVYFPLKQHPGTRVIMYLRTDGADAVAGSVRGVIASVDSRLRSTRVRTGAEILDRVLANRRVGTQLLSGFAIIALVLAGLGTYGVVAYSVSQRRRELAIRLALGSSTAGIIGRIVGGTLVKSACGITAGLVASAFGSASIATLLYGMRPFDRASFALSAAMLFIVALIAAWIPARRATQADIVSELRSE